MSSLQLHDHMMNARLREPQDTSAKRLLLVDSEAHTRARLKRILAAEDFSVTGVDGIRNAMAAIREVEFAYAVIELRLGDGNGLALIKHLRRLQNSPRIVVVTGFDSFATVILALRAGAADYLPKPIDEGALLDALLDRMPMLPPVPDTPLGVTRVCWEHVQRVFEQCDRNVTETARRLGMHRRSLQRMLSKRAPRPRREELS